MEYYSTIKRNELLINAKTWCSVKQKRCMTLHKRESDRDRKPWLPRACSMGGAGYKGGIKDI